MERVVVFPCHAVKSELFRAAVLGQADASSSKDELHRSNIFEHPIGTIGKWKTINPATDSSCCAATNTLQAATRFFRHTEGGNRGIVIVSIFLSKFIRSQVELN